MDSTYDVAIFADLGDLIDSWNSERDAKVFEMWPKLPINASDEPVKVVESVENAKVVESVDLRRSAREFLDMPFRGMSRRHFIRKSQNQTRAVRQYLRTAERHCRCLACPECQRWLGAGEPRQSPCDMRCPAGMKVLQSVLKAVLASTRALRSGRRY